LKEDGSSEVVKTKNIVIATGSEVTPFPGIEVSKNGYLNSEIIYYISLFSSHLLCIINSKDM
jgi:pyruvate/2-oxoglutarate dehydrogenase complex dihydrolipoamide dehydrogenase (E3) component